MHFQLQHRPSLKALKCHRTVVFPELILEPSHTTAGRHWRTRNNKCIPLMAVDGGLFSMEENYCHSYNCLLYFDLKLFYTQLLVFIETEKCKGNVHL